MRRTHSLPHRLAAAVAGLLCVSLVLALAGVNPGNDAPRSAAPATEKVAEVVPVFGTVEAAKNEPVLVLMADERGVRGWVAGKADAKGAKVNIKAGAASVFVPLGEDNTFTWEQTAK